MSLTVANLSNGCYHNPEAEHIASFLSSHSHHWPYLWETDPMPLAATRELLRGGVVYLHDASPGKLVTDALAFGAATWALVFNRAIGKWDEKAVPWSTPEMARATGGSAVRRVKGNVRRMQRIYGDCGAVRVGIDYPYRYGSPWTFSGRPIPITRYSAGSGPVLMLVCRRIDPQLDDASEHWFNGDKDGNHAVQG